MTNLIAFFLTTAVLLGAVFWVGFTIGAERQRALSWARKADEHARACRAAAAPLLLTDQQAIVGRLLKTPGFSLDTIEHEHSTTVTVRRRGVTQPVRFEFTKANGTLLTMEPCT